MSTQEFQPANGCVSISGCIVFISSVSHVVLPKSETQKGRVVLQCGAEIYFKNEELEKVLSSLGMLAAKRLPSKSLDMRKAKKPATKLIV